MKRRTLIENLKGLVELQDLARSYYNGDVSTWVGLGLITGDEMAEWRAGSEAQSALYAAIHRAEDAVPMPDFNHDPRFPKEYVALVDQVAGLKPLVDLDKRVVEIVRYLDDRSYAGRGLLEVLNLHGLARQAKDAINAAEDDYHGGYWELQGQVERKEREGTIARRVRHSIADDWNLAKKTARTTAEAAFLGSEWFGKPVQEVIRRKEQLDKLVDRRREEKVRPIREAMAKVITAALPKGAK